MTLDYSYFKSSKDDIPTKKLKRLTLSTWYDDLFNFTLQLNYLVLMEKTFIVDLISEDKIECSSSDEGETLDNSNNEVNSPQVKKLLIILLHLCIL